MCNVKENIWQLKLMTGNEKVFELIDAFETSNWFFEITHKSLRCCSMPCNRVQVHALLVVYQDVFIPLTVYFLFLLVNVKEEKPMKIYLYLGKVYVCRIQTESHQSSRSPCCTSCGTKNGLSADKSCSRNNKWLHWKHNIERITTVKKTTTVKETKHQVTKTACTSNFHWIWWRLHT